MIIAIDGPSGAGKSTVGKRLAKELGLLYLDTGAMYRAGALAALQAGITLEDKEEIAETVRNAKIELSGEPDDLHVFLNGTDVSQEIRTAEVSQTASIISAISEVRKMLVEQQRETGNRLGRCVLDGRDIGTVVFPNADIKFFLTASPASRAERRFAEDSAKGLETTVETTLTEIIERDKRDSTREDSPLKRAEDAILIDSSEIKIEKVLEQMLKIVREK